MIRALNCSKILFPFSKANIPFDFDLPSQIPTPKPNQKHTDATPSDKEVKIFKAKRKGLASTLLNKQKAYEDDSDFLSKSQKIYQHEFGEKLRKGEKTRNYYDYEIQRGEDLIDDIPVDPYYEYKTADFQTMVEERKNQFARFATNNEDDYEGTTAAELRKLADSFQTSKHRYEAEEYKKYLDKYPGSLKGPNPEDDPKSFMAYASKEMPDSIQAELIRQEGEFKKVHRKPKVYYVSEAMGYDRPEIPDIQNINDNIQNDLRDHTGTVYIPYDEVPLAPKVEFEEWHSHIQKIQLWWHFSYKYRQMSLEKQANKESKLHEQLLQTQTNVYGDFIEWKPTIYSMYIYYRTLPKEVRERSGVRTIFLGLEHHQPDRTYAEKEEALNLAAYLTQPLDAVSERGMKDVLHKKRYYLTPHLTERIFNIHPEFTWDMNDFLDEVKAQKLRSMSTVKEKEQFFPQPPETQHISESHLANLPIDFYDNDDGFWDQYIQQKLNSYYKYQPLLRTNKKHFIH